jgi:hypothetical protein
MKSFFTEIGQYFYMTLMTIKSTSTLRENSLKSRQELVYQLHVYSHYPVSYTSI